MKKLLFGTLMVGALASSSMAILQMDVPASLFPIAGPSGSTMTMMNMATYPATMVAGPDGFPLAYHLIFDYDAAPPASPVVTSFTLTSGECTQTWTVPMFSVFYSPGPNFPIAGQFTPFLDNCYPPACEPSCYVAPQMLDFGTVISPDPVTLSFMICNNSVGDCPPISGDIMENCDNFSVHPTSYTLGTGECIEVHVTFVGTHAGPRVCDILTGCGPVICYVNDMVAADEQPAVFALAEAYPNPFNPSTTISYSVPETQDATLSVFNTAGQLVQTLVSGMVERGEHKVVFDASSLSSGVYVYTLQTANQTAMKKMVLVK